MDPRQRRVSSRFPHILNPFAGMKRNLNPFQRASYAKRMEEAITRQKAREYERQPRVTGLSPAAFENEKRYKVIRGIQEIFNEDNFLRGQREALNPQLREIYDLKMLFLQALAEGRIRNFEDFHSYVKRFLIETHRDQKAGNYATEATNKLMRAFSPQQGKRLKSYLEDLSIIALGNNPSKWRRSTQESGNEQSFSE